ncbi:MAG: hypothetical protein LBT00_05350 [Spirochaetaceae bacterium]|jgi:uncharacterized membrane protein YciS (DUF1049 family)|nr:hypothetical protein [Spirochaetaceae bacterium]
MRRIVLFVLLFVVVLCFGLFLGFNWDTRFDLSLGFGSEDVQISVIMWTLGAFAVGAVCTTIVFAINLLKKGRKVKEQEAKMPNAKMPEAIVPEADVPELEEAR